MIRGINLDPFALDTKANHRKAQWLVDQIAELRLSLPRHLRGIQYVLLGRPKPNGEPYCNTPADWL